MLAKQGTLKVRQEGPTLTFQLEGRGTMHHSPALRERAEQALAAGVQSVRVDLRHCTYLDSTFLGTLLYFTRLVQRGGQGNFALVSPSPACCDLLRLMRLDKFYPVVTEAESAEGWTVVCVESVEIPRFQQTVVEAHQHLAELPGAAGEPFRPIAHLIAHDQEEADRKGKDRCP